MMLGCRGAPCSPLDASPGRLPQPLTQTAQPRQEVKVRLARDEALLRQLPTSCPCAAAAAAASAAAGQADVLPARPWEVQRGSQRSDAQLAQAVQRGELLVAPQAAAVGELGARGVGQRQALQRGQGAEVGHLLGGGGRVVRSSAVAWHSAQQSHGIQLSSRMAVSSAVAWHPAEQSHGSQLSSRMASS